ncbi:MULTISPECIES: succinylglutamate desuccinylase/aspartoacylase family protein [Shewanella]|uniref:Succinylglutamate desuccinylase n=1 Tax=Shewanella japonica TaxID=93973 RepID=A0ABM6JIQ7_9GAMM|nr:MULTISPECIES: succinylglutamate desuccinylase/aspartoacylase family protein [Shewanella]ARD21683.1 succinylglutamate desuccinylase [Shewanella japonica]MBQ4888524.1 succinylglutamate desuccinylase/aspartoacylase family protein [Shewanella sp. MMG014]
MAPKREAFTIGEFSIDAGTRASIKLPAAKLYNDTPLELHVEVFHSKKPGPVLLVCAAIHGDELNGIEICRRLIDKISIRTLTGTLMVVPIVNVFGFIHQSRYLPDRRDLNRCFPGSAKGALASRLAHLFSSELMSKATHIVDLHTGAIHRDNFPQIRCDTDDEVMMAMATAFGAPVIMDSKSVKGSMRGYANEKGIACILYEAGEALRFSELSIKSGVTGVLNVMRYLGMLNSKLKPTASINASRSYWLRSEADGLVNVKRKIGARVSKGCLLANVVNPLGGEVTELRSPTDGIIIGLTNIPVANEGEALFHIAQFVGDDIEIANEHLDEFISTYA